VRRMPRNGNGKMKQAFSNIYLRIRHICHSVHEKETSINHNEGLTDISLPKLEYSGVLAVYLNPDLKTFNSGITHVGSIPPRNQRLHKPRFHQQHIPRLDPPTPRSRQRILHNQPNPSPLRSFLPTPPDHILRPHSNTQPATPQLHSKGPENRSIHSHARKVFQPGAFLITRSHRRFLPDL
jgi:hypothetical protein